MFVDILTTFNLLTTLGLFTTVKLSKFLNLSIFGRQYLVFSPHNDLIDARKRSLHLKSMIDCSFASAVGKNHSLLLRLKKDKNKKMRKVKNVNKSIFEMRFRGESDFT